MREWPSKSKEKGGIRIKKLLKLFGMEVLLITILIVGFASAQESYPNQPITMVLWSSGPPQEWGVILMGKDPVATKAVTMLAVGHEPYEQSVLSIAAKAGQGTTDINHIQHNTIVKRVKW